MTETTPPQPKDEDDLNEQFFTTILRKRCTNTFRGTVSSRTIRREHSGVLSQVYRVSITSFTDDDVNAADVDAADVVDTSSDDHSCGGGCPPLHWIVKLVRDDLNLKWMCQNETRFYSIYAPALMSSPPQPGGGGGRGGGGTLLLPFRVPSYLDGSEQHLILEQILDVETFALVDGCPTGKLDTMLECMAALHATWWKHPLLTESVAESGNDDNNSNKNRADDCDVPINAKSLVFPVGMGQRLPKLQKEGLFVRSWKESLESMSFGGSNDDDNDVKSFIQTMCQVLETLRLRDVHDMVHMHRITLVHGDFHVANFLWPKSTRTSRTSSTSPFDDDDDDGSGSFRPYLVDWATCGYGNPLVDFVFFLVVSTNNDCVSNANVWLRKYYELLLKYNPNLRSILKIETLMEMMMPVLLCQWLILVSYDSMCRTIAMSESDQAKREMTSRHFNNVNVRTVMAMKSLDGWDNFLNNIPKAKDTEKLEAQDFCDKTPLAI